MSLSLNVTESSGVSDVQTIARAIELLSTEELRQAKTLPIIVKLSGHVQTNDRLAIREMGRQIAEAEGVKAIEEQPEGDADQDGEDSEVGPAYMSLALRKLIDRNTHLRRYRLICWRC
jgi:origin recognition complex subunit 4